MQSEFERLSKTRLPSRRLRDAATDSSASVEQLRRRHAGVIGLSACVLSAPYQVPDFMPAVLMMISTHLDDPQPIQVTRNALREHKPPPIWRIQISDFGLLDPKRDPDHHQNCITWSLSHALPLQKKSSKSVHKFASNPTDRQTNRQTDKQTEPKT